MPLGKPRCLSHSVTESQSCGACLTQPVNFFSVFFPLKGRLKGFINVLGSWGHSKAMLMTLILFETKHFCGNEGCTQKRLELQLEVSPGPRLARLYTCDCMLVCVCLYVTICSCVRPYMSVCSYVSICLCVSIYDMTVCSCVCLYMRVYLYLCVYSGEQSCEGKARGSSQNVAPVGAADPRLSQRTCSEQMGNSAAAGVPGPWCGSASPDSPG